MNMMEQNMSMAADTSDDKTIIGGEIGMTQRGNALLGPFLVASFHGDS